MASLLDIGPLTETVSVRGNDFEISGISADGILRLLSRFPIIRAALTGALDKMALDVNMMLALGPDIVASIIVLSYFRDVEGEDPEARTKRMEAEEKVAAKLPIDTQSQFLEVIGRLTFPRGIRPFVDMLNKLGDAAEASGLAAGMKLPAASNTASRKDTRPEKPGATPPES